MKRTIVVPLSAAVALATLEAAAQPAQLSLDLGGAPLELTLIPAGSFRQGSPADERGRRDDEGPREVTLTRGFYLGTVPVTRGQFERFVAATGYRTESETGRSGGFGLSGDALAQRPEFTWRTPGFAQDANHPAVLLTFDDAQRFVAWAAQRTGRPLRLPTEAEWERACRAGSSTAWYTGDTAEYGRTAGWFNVARPLGTRPVRGRLPNGYGLFDMVGHVQQWVDDWYQPLDGAAATEPHSATPTGSPPRRVLRGGSWLRGVEKGRCAARERATPGSRNADTGLRVAMNADAAAPPPPVAPPPTATPTARQPAPQTPGAPQENTSASAHPLPLLGALVAAFAAAWIAWRRRRTGRSQGYDEAGRAVPFAAPRLVAEADGFRVYARHTEANHRVHVGYQLQGRAASQWVTLDPSESGQFVFTGHTPEQLVVLAFTGLEHAVHAAHGASGHFNPHAPFDAHRHVDPSAAHAGATHGWESTTHAHDEPAPLPVYQGPPSAY